MGGSQSLESWEEYAALVEGNDLAAAHAEIPALDTPVTVYAFTDLTRPESDAAAPTLAGDLPLVGGRPRRADLRLSRQLH